MNNQTNKNSRKTRPVFLHAIATAVPENRLEQSEILAFMQALQADTPEKAAFMQKIYDGSAIDTRYSVLSDYRKHWKDFDFYPRNAQLEPSPGTAKRNEMFVREADRLALQASQALFDSANTNALQFVPRDITHLITVSCTGFSAPGFDLSLQNGLKLSPNLQRFHLGFMGCYAAFPALKLAWNLCLANPKSRVLIVDVELCTLHFQKGWNTDTVVANALFADGAAAALVSAFPTDSHRPLYKLHDFSTRMVPESNEEMAWVIGDTGFDMKLSAYVPRVIDANMPEILDGILSRNQLKRNDVAHWAIHPGGRAILDKLDRSLALPPGALDDSYATLRNFGNMSSATIFFVLKFKAELAGQLDTAGRQDKHSKIVFAAAFGPGLTVESALLELNTRPSPPPRQALFFPDLRQRSHALEKMDNPTVDQHLLKRTINQFGMLNRLFSGHRSILKREFFRHMDDPNKVYTILDIGAGGGDISIWMVREAARRGRKIRVTCIDQDERIIPWAKEAVSLHPEIEVVHARAEDLSSLGDFDFMFCNHVLHHLESEAILGLLKAAARHCAINFVFNDLKRSHWAYIGYTIFTGLLVRRSLAFYDGRLSIRRGFTRQELVDLIDQSGFANHLRVGIAKPARLFITRMFSA